MPPDVSRRPIPTLRRSGSGVQAGDLAAEGSLERGSLDRTHRCLSRDPAVHPQAEGLHPLPGAPRPQRPGGLCPHHGCAGGPLPCARSRQGRFILFLFTPHLRLHLERGRETDKHGCEQHPSVASCEHTCAGIKPSPSVCAPTRIEPATFRRTGRCSTHRAARPGMAAALIGGERDPERQPRGSKGGEWGDAATAQSRRGPQTLRRQDVPPPPDTALPSPGPRVPASPPGRALPRSPPAVVPSPATSGAPTVHSRH